MPKKTNSTRPYFLAGILLFLIIIASYLYSKSLSPSNYEISKSQSLQNKLRSLFTKEDSLPNPTATPTPLHPGPATYNISHTDNGGPTISQVIFDPVDIQKNSTLTLTIKIPLNNPAKSITTTFQSDNETQSLDFINSDSHDNYQIWTTKFKLKDTVDYKYILNINATNEAGTSEAVVAPRS